ncbi:hypothetical protein BJ508DRAFT_50104 [Ascobolus immersus RN42]|uniref:Uncharacterized protein n=1 Tax=Ascobolus immersus RN42 TaxID=1160509 RepID=A0A3N4HH95_ASCIM|nr:hypothetical protein BJ508DRAFT_50104 [Ascobolus immersus RN42]
MLYPPYTKSQQAYSADSDLDYDSGYEEPPDEEKVPRTTRAREASHGYAQASSTATKASPHTSAWGPLDSTTHIPTIRTTSPVGTISSSEISEKSTLRRRPSTVQRSDPIDIPSPKRRQLSNRSAASFQTASEASRAILQALPSSMLQAKSAPCTLSPVNVHANETQSDGVSSSASSFVDIQAAGSSRQINAGNVHGNVTHGDLHNNIFKAEKIDNNYNNCQIFVSCTKSHKPGRGCSFFGMFRSEVTV